MAAWRWAGVGALVAASIAGCDDGGNAGPNAGTGGGGAGSTSGGAAGGGTGSGAAGGGAAGAVGAGGGGVTSSAASGGAGGGSATCTLGSGVSPDRQTLVFVRHAETMANLCEDTCDDETCCEPDVCAPGCDDDCNCSENLENFSPHGWSEIEAPLINKLRALNLRWDKIIVSPAWRTQATIRPFLEAESLCGEIVPELDECWNDDPGSCSTPPWESRPYEIIEFTGGAMRLKPRAYRPEWDPDPATNPRPEYDHSEGSLECENIIMDRAREYIEELFSDGAMAVLAVTHAVTGAGLLERLTGSDDYWLRNASAYTVLTRSTSGGDWTVEVNNE